MREVRASVGAGFVYPICGEMRTMPGLGTNPAAARIDLDENGEIVGLNLSQWRRRVSANRHCAAGAGGGRPGGLRLRAPFRRACLRRTLGNV